MVKPVALFILLAAGLAANQTQRPGHPFDASRIRSAIDSFVIVTRITTGAWRPIGGVIQTVAHDQAAIRVAVEYAFPDSKQRVEMAMDPATLAPIAHWETLTRTGRGDTHGEIRFSDGRARGAYILSKGIVDTKVDTGLVDDDAATVLLSALPLDTGRTFFFRTFASPGQVETTRVRVEGTETVTVPAGRFDTYRLLVMARDTSSVFVTTSSPHRIVLVRLAAGTQEMRLINQRR